MYLDKHRAPTERLLYWTSCYRHVAPPEQSTECYSSNGSANVRSIIVSCVCTGANVCDVPK